MPKFKIVAQSNQNLFDLAINYYGNIELVDQIIKDNPAIDGIDSYVPAGMEILIDRDFVADKLLLQFYGNNKTVVASGQDRKGGIGEMGIEIDFIVS